MVKRIGVEAELADALFGFFEENESTYRRLLEPDPHGIEYMIDGMIGMARLVINVWNAGGR